MYDLISDIIGHVWTNTSGTEQSIIYYICGVVIIIILAVFIDILYRLFSHFWR